MQCVAVCWEKSTYQKRELIQGGKDAHHAVSCRSLSANEPLIIGLFHGKYPVKIRHPMHLRHPVSAERELVSKREKAHITGWRRLIGSPKLHIIFHKRATK